MICNDCGTPLGPYEATCSIRCMACELRTLRDVVDGIFQEFTIDEISRQPRSVYIAWEAGREIYLVKRAGNATASPI